MIMTMTHSEKSHICQMKAWPYRQECRGHDPTKKNLLCCWSLLIGKVCMYKLLRTVSNVSCPEMNSDTLENDMRWHTGCYCAEFMNSTTQNPQIRSNIHKESQEGDKPAREIMKSTNIRTGSRQVSRIWFPSKFSFFGTMNSYTITSLLLGSVAQFLFLTCQFITNFLIVVLLLLISYASSSCLKCGTRLQSCCFAQSHRLVFSWFFFDVNFVFILTSVIFTQSSCNFLQIEHIFSSLW